MVREAVGILRPMIVAAQRVAQDRLTRESPAKAVQGGWREVVERGGRRREEKSSVKTTQARLYMRLPIGRESIPHQ